MKTCCPSCRSPREAPVNIVSVASVWNSCSRCGWVWRKSLLQTVLDQASDKIEQVRGTLRSSLVHSEPASVPAVAAAVIAASAHAPAAVHSVKPAATVEAEDSKVLEFRQGFVDPERIATSVEDEVASWGGDAPTQVVRAEALADPAKVAGPAKAGHYYEGGGQDAVEDAVASWGGAAPAAMATAASREDVQVTEIDALDAGLRGASPMRSATDEQIRADQKARTEQKPNQTIRTLTPIIDVWRPQTPMHTALQPAAPVQAAASFWIAPPASVAPLNVAPPAALPVQPPAPVEVPPPVQDHQRLTASVDRTLQNVDDLCDVFARLQQQLAGLERSCETLLGTTH